jgi:HrpA-like RNA helicase
LQGEIKKRKLTTINPFCVILESKTSSEQSNLAINEFKYTSELNNSGKKYTRKIVMATNIAESSLTVKGVVYVIDNGYHLESSFFPKTGARSLIETRISQAAATQRKGRAGRTRDGFCYRMYTEEEFNKFDKFPIPDVQKTDITSDVLDIFMLPYTKDA